MSLLQLGHHPADTTYLPHEDPPAATTSRSVIQEVVVLSAANICVTALRFVAMRGWIFARPTRTPMLDARRDPGSWTTYEETT